MKQKQPISPPKPSARVQDLEGDARAVMLALIRIGVQEQGTLRDAARSLGQELTEESLISLIDSGFVKCVWDGHEGYAFVPWNPTRGEYDEPEWT